MLHADPIAYPPRGLSREEAARYLGIGATKLDELVEQKLIPRPKKIGRRTVFDRYQLDAVFADLPSETGNRLDQLLASGKIVGLE